jgi:TonB family protein
LEKHIGNPQPSIGIRRLSINSQLSYVVDRPISFVRIAIRALLRYRHPPPPPPRQEAPPVPAVTHTPICGTAPSALLDKINGVVTATFLGSDCVGRTIDGRFTLLQWLGGTEQSSVFLTQLDGDPAQKAAIKFTPANAADADSRIAQWTSIRTLSHPHLMPVFDAGRCQVDGLDLLYVVTEYADEILSEILRQRPLTPGETREMLEPVLDALSWLHGRNLLHGHLKPSNIMVVDERLKLSTDRLHSAGEPNWTSTSSGKYDAPEATLMTMSPAADVWSLGVVMVEALTQRTPRWNGYGSGDPLVPSSLPAPFSRLARECLHVDPALRATLTGVQTSLQPPRTVQPAGRTTPPSRALPRKPRSRPAVLIAAAVLVGGAIVAALVFRTHQPSSAPAVEHSFTPAVQPQPQPTPPAPQPQPHKRAAVGSVVKGAVADQSIPDVPQHILDTIQGHIHVRVSLQVNADGSVAGATLDSPGPSRYFARRALESAQNWKFTPAQTGGRAVASQWTLQFRFSQDGTTVTPTETSP